MNNLPFTRTPEPGWERHWLGVPYRESGRERATGLDCWGLCMAVWRDEFGWEAPDPFPAWRAEDFAAAKDGRIAASRFARLIKPSFARIHHRAGPGCCVVLRLGGDEAHAGVITGGGRFLHTSEATSSGISRLDAFAWKNRIGGFYAPR